MAQRQGRGGAKSVEDLHSPQQHQQQTALTEKGELVSGRGDAVKHARILTGSDPAGNFSTAAATPRAATGQRSGEGSAIVGHHA